MDDRGARHHRMAGRIRHRRQRRRKVRVAACRAGQDERCLRPTLTHRSAGQLGGFQVAAVGRAASYCAAGARTPPRSAFGTSVGSRTLQLWSAVVIAAIFEVRGARPRSPSARKPARATRCFVLRV